MQLDPFAIQTIALLEECSRISGEQLTSLDRFIESNEPTIRSALFMGLVNEDEGHSVALRLLKLQTERLALKSTINMRRSTVQRPLEESAFFLSTVTQVFQTLAEWMRVNNIDRITVESLPDLQEHITLDLIIKNGYRKNFVGSLSSES